MSNDFFFFDLSVICGLNRCDSALPVKIPAGEFSVNCYLQTSKAEFRIAEGTQHRFTGLVVLQQGFAVWAESF